MGSDNGAKAAKKSEWWESFVFMNASDSKSFNFWVSVAAILVAICSCAEMTSPTQYGKFGGDAVSIGISPQIGWWIMELPCSMMFLYQFFVRGGPQSQETVPRLMALIFCIHYSYRGWVFPALMRVHNKSSNFDLATAFGSWIVTLLHGFLNARWYAEHGKHLNMKWLKSARFWIGLALYYSGFVMIIWHDNIMRDLRDPTGDGPRYKIPNEGLFQVSTCAHYFVELWAWFGFAVLSWGPNGAFIFMVSFVNLVPRSITTHQWYISKFGDEYPADRAYIFPGIF